MGNAAFGSLPGCLCLRSAIQTLGACYAILGALLAGDHTELVYCELHMSVFPTTLLAAEALFKCGIF